MTGHSKYHRWAIVLAVVGLAVGPFTVPPAGARHDGITFSDIAAGDGAGIGYRRGPGVRDAEAEAAYRQQPFTFSGTFLHEMPTMTRLAGVAVLDYDGDGHLDLFVTNGPSTKGDPNTGPGHSLYRNLIGETGRLEFEDVSARAGIQANAHNGAGVAFGDLDNDGDEDILVLGDNEPNRLFANNGDATFADVSAASGLAADSGSHTSASFGDVDGDGLLDVVVGQSMDRHNMDTCFNFYPDGRDIGRNQLYLNRGGLQFEDVSQPSGIQDNRWFKDANGPRPDLDGLPTLTWATALVDIDQDGDADAVFADDQCGAPSAKLGGVDRSMLHVFRNDGAGRFTDVSGLVGTDHFGSWMGLAFADYDSNGTLDIFGSNFGDYAIPQFGGPYDLGDQATRPLFGQPEGTFTDPGATDVKATTFGWGTGALDYDNDGYTDEIYRGGLDLGLFIARDNPGTLLHNRGGDETGRFDADRAAYPATDDRIRRNPYGLATGDLDGNGFIDIVSASTLRVPPSVPPVPPTATWGAPSDETASFFQRMIPLDPQNNPPELWTFGGLQVEDGTLAVEANSGNGNGWVKVTTVGTVGITDRGEVNRDGIGAIVSFTPRSGRTSMTPVLGGSSFLSQHDLTQSFGLGSARKGTVDVLWPGKVRNRLYDVGRGERVTFPEIPCSFDTDTMNLASYAVCVGTALHDAVRAGVIDTAAGLRFFASALRAYDEAHSL